MDVQEADVGQRPEPVEDAGGSRAPGAGTGLVRLLADRELDLALEHPERVDVVGVGVRIDGEIRAEAELEGLDLRELDEHAVLPDALALVWMKEHRPSVSYEHLFV